MNSQNYIKRIEIITDRGIVKSRETIIDLNSGFAYGRIKPADKILVRDLLRG